MMRRRKQPEQTVREPQTKLVELDDEELIGEVDGSDVERVVNELLARGGADARLGVMLWRAVMDFYVSVDPESCV
jgi:hypothetical protein